MNADIDENLYLRIKTEKEFIQKFCEWKGWSEAYEQAMFEKIWSRKQFQIQEEVRQQSLIRLEIAQKPVFNSRFFILSKVIPLTPDLRLTFICAAGELFY